MVASWLPLNPGRPPVKSSGVTPFCCRKYCGISRPTWSFRSEREAFALELHQLIRAGDRFQAAGAMGDEHGEFSIDIALRQHPGSRSLESGLNTRRPPTRPDPLPLRKALTAAYCSPGCISPPHSADRSAHPTGCCRDDSASLGSDRNGAYSGGEPNCLVMNHAAAEATDRPKPAKSQKNDGLGWSRAYKLFWNSLVAQDSEPFQHTLKTMQAILNCLT